MSKGELAHRLIKRFYSSSNKKEVEEQFAKQERRRTLIQRQQDFDNLTHADVGDVDPSPLLHHHMASEPRRDNIFSLPAFLVGHQNDPAVKVM